MLRPLSARWFQVLCPRTESVPAIAALARTGAVEIEVRRHRAEDFPVSHLREGLNRYEELLSLYRRYWARAPLQHSPTIAPPRLVLRRALTRIDAWRRRTDPVIERLQDLEEEANRLQLLERILHLLQHSLLDFSLVANAGPFMEVFCAILPRQADLHLPDSVLYRAVPWGKERCLIILGQQRVIAAVKDQAKAAKGRILERPDWLRGDAVEARHLVAERLGGLKQQIRQAYAKLDALYAAFSLGEVLGELAFLDWFSKHVGGLELAGRNFVWITGWTSDLQGQRLLDALDRAGTRALLQFVAPPPALSSPQLLANPRWLKPFETFTRALGIPGPDEADPTPLLALVVPLLFGYMFGDVGQGLVLLVVGLWLRRRFQLANLLIAGGVSATLFGFLFGSLFAREDLLPALWLHPLSSPLVVIAVPLVFAVGLLSLGQLLGALGAFWRQSLGHWLSVDAGFVVMYLGLIVAFAIPAATWVALLGLVWYLAGAVVWGRRLKEALVAMGRLFENGLRIMINTLSFARVGAFALAHASLSVAVISLAEASASVAIATLVLVAGNLVIILLEGLVVSIQTTRLVLFEFFVRFLHGEGRVFRPLPLPPTIVAEEIR